MSLPSNQEPRPASDRGFQHIVEIGSAAGLGMVFGCMACLQWTEFKGPSFHWHWLVLFWISVGIFAGIYFWRQIWQAQDAPAGGARKHLLKGWLVLAVACATTFAYSVRTFKLENFKEVLMGVFAASIVLSFVGWMIFRLMRMFEEDGKER